MAVSISRTGGTLTVTIAIDVSDIIAAVGIPASEKKAQALQRCLNELSLSYEAHSLTDAAIDARVTAQTANATKLKAARPTGNL